MNEIQLARLYYKKLKCDVEIANFEKINLPQFCERLKGFNLNKHDNMFDVNYGIICATVLEVNGEFTLAKGVEIWGENTLYQDYNLED